MPVVLTIVSAIVSGTFLWLIWGGGFGYIDHKLRARDLRNADAKRWRATEERRRLSPLRSISDPRDGAAILMFLVARARSVPTPEQIAVIEHEARTVLEFGDDLHSRLVYAGFAAEQVPSVEVAFETLEALFAKALNRSERADLIAMLEQVAAVHAGPTPEQERTIRFAQRRLAAA
jgi:hypothetical protein